MISRQFNYLFLLSPRTGSTATASALGQHLYGEWIPGQDVLDDNGMIIVQRKHCTLNELLEHKYLNQKEAKTLFKFTTVRNPFDSAVSSWVKKRTIYQPLLGARPTNPI